MVKTPLIPWIEDKEKFIQIKDFSNFYSGCNNLNHIGLAQFVISDEFDQYQRVLFSLIDFLVQVGGSFNSLRAIGFLITAIFSYRLFYASLIRALFFFKTTEEEWKNNFKKAEKKFNKKYGKTRNSANKEAIDYLGDTRKKINFKSKFQDYSEIEKLKLCTLNDSSASEYSEHNDPEADADAYSLDKKLGYHEIKEKMLDKLGYKTLKYDYKSFSIFKALICCHILKKRAKLLRNNETRKLVLYNKGVEKLDKEIDIVEMVKKFRKLDIIVKYIFSKDQQLLLDLKHTHHISSDEESERYVLGLQKKKVIKKHKLLQKYIDNIKSKKLDDGDLKLLKLLGLNDVRELLKPGKVNKINEEWIIMKPALGKSNSFTKFQREKSNISKYSPEAMKKRLLFPENHRKYRRDSSSSDGHSRKNIYRSRKNMERKMAKRQLEGHRDSKPTYQDLMQSELFHKIHETNYNSRERHKKPISRYRSNEDRRKDINGSYSLLSLSKQNSLQKARNAKDSFEED
jgi:hypothetical protein